MTKDFYQWMLSYFLNNNNDNNNNNNNSNDLIFLKFQLPAYQNMRPLLLVPNN